MATSNRPREVPEAHRGYELPYERGRALRYSWTAPSFTAHHAARISNAYHREAARSMMRTLERLKPRGRFRFGRGYRGGRRPRRRPGPHDRARRPRSAPRRVTLGHYMPTIPAHRAT